MSWPSKVTLAGAGTGVSGDQPRQRGLAGAGSADDGGQRAGPGGQRDVVEQLLSALDVKSTELTSSPPVRVAASVRRTRCAAGEHQVDVADGDQSPSVRAPTQTLAPLTNVPLTLCASWISAPSGRRDQIRVMTGRQDVLDDDVVVVAAATDPAAPVRWRTELRSRPLHGTPQVGAIELRGFEGFRPDLGERLPAPVPPAARGWRAGRYGTGAGGAAPIGSDSRRRGAGRWPDTVPAAAMSGAGVDGPGRIAVARCGAEGCRRAVRVLRTRRPRGTGRRDGRASPAPWAVAGRPSPRGVRSSKVKRGPSGLPMLMLWPSRMSTTGTR